MSWLLTFLFPALVVVMLAMPLIPVYRRITGGESVKCHFVFNLAAFFGIAALMVILPIGDFVAYAADAGAAGAVTANMTFGAGMAYIAAALAGGLSAIGAGIAVASAAPAAIGATSEDPKSFGKAIIFVVLGEGVAIYGLLVAILIINKL